MFISIGPECDVQFNIKSLNINGSRPTLFFDWLITDMLSVNKIISTSNINEILYPENIIHKKNKIIINSLSLFESLHDIHIKEKLDSSDINNFIENLHLRHIIVIFHVSIIYCMIFIFPK